MHRIAARTSVLRRATTTRIHKAQQLVIGAPKTFHHKANLLNADVVGDRDDVKQDFDEYDDENDEDDYRLISIDRSNLIRKTYSPLSDTTGGKREPETAMIRHLKTKIKGSGPISISTFIHESLLNPKYGYYYTGGMSGNQQVEQQEGTTTTTGQQQDKVDQERIFGARGDFVTSPEISSVFGELIGVWCVEMWHQLKCPKRLQIVELGPGRGTLMHDLLHSIHTLSKKNSQLVSQFLSSDISVHMVEASPQLKQIQKNTLSQEQGSSTTNSTEEVRTYCNLPVTWHSEFEKVPDLSDQPDTGILVIAHEFFDALPVFQFQYTDRGWCEVLVDVNDDEQSNRPEHFKYVLAPSQTFSNILIDLSPVEPKIGNRIEISPASMGIMEQIGSRLQKQKGASLVIDYGKDEPMGFTLMGIKNHQFTETPLESPGQADLSVFVDFSSLRHSLHKLDQVKIWGPQNQGNFLYQMGIDVRLLQVLRNPNIPEAMLTNIIGAYHRLTSNKEMGSQYQVMCVTSPLNDAPAGFALAPKAKDIPKPKLTTNEAPAATKPSAQAEQPKPQSAFKRRPSMFT